MADGRDQHREADVTVHDHREFVEGCYRCELGRDEALVYLNELLDEGMIALQFTPRFRLEERAHEDGVDLLVFDAETDRAVLKRYITADELGRF